MGEDWKQLTQKCRSGCLLGRGNLRCNFCSEVIDLLLNAFTNNIEGKPFDSCCSGLEHLLNGLFVILDKRLVES